MDEAKLEAVCPQTLWLANLAINKKEYYLLISFGQE